MADSAGDDAAEPSDAADDQSSPGGSREVIVPLRLYKAITVFSTMFAIAFVLGGFVLLDMATNNATAEAGAVDPILAIVGLLALVGGAAVYAFSTRFRTEGMGKSKDQSDESSDNG